MKNNITLIIILLFSQIIYSQGVISKTHCLKNQNFTTYEQITLISGEIFMTGDIENNNAPFGSERFFIAKFTEKGDIIWFKELEEKIRWSFIKPIQISNGNIILFFSSYDVLQIPKMVCIDTDANNIWSKEAPVFPNEVIDIPSEKAIFLNWRFWGLASEKINYNGDAVFSTEYERNSNQNPYFSKTTNFENDKILLAANLGYYQTTNFNFDSIGIYTLNAKNGTILNKKLIYSTNKQDTIILKKVKTIDNKIFILGHTGHDDYSKKNSRFNQAFIIEMDKNFVVKAAKKVKINSKQAFSFIDILKSDDSSFLLIGTNNQEYSLDSAFTVSKLDINTYKIDSTIFLKRGYTKRPKFAYNNNTIGYSYSHDVINGFNVATSKQIFSNLNCNLKFVKTTVTDLNISIANDNLSINNLTVQPYKTVAKSNKKDLQFQTFDICPECNCPDTIKFTASICSSQPYETIVNGKVKYYNTAGIYYDTIISPKKCISFRELSLTIKPFLSQSIQKFLCATTPSITIASKTYTKEGIYTDTLKTKTGCDSILNITIKSLADLKVSLGEDKEILEGDKINLVAAANYPNLIQNYTWFPSGTSTCDTCKSVPITPNQTQTYAVKASIGDCFALDSVTVKTLNQNLVYVPNAFSPNNDQNNDLFRPYSADAVEEIEYFIVYDRWGNHIYEAVNFLPNDEKTGWDGIYKNIPANQDVYTYAIQIRLKNGQTQRYVGDVKLFRF